MSSSGSSATVICTWTSWLPHSGINSACTRSPRCKMRGASPLVVQRGGPHDKVCGPEFITITG
jgi:hypothetical protein